MKKLVVAIAAVVQLGMLQAAEEQAEAAPFDGTVTFASGNLDMVGNAVINMDDPINAQDAATKAYVDAATSGGGDNLGNHTATQALNMNSQKIINLATPTANTDAATKAYVDASSAGVGDNLGNHTATQTLNMNSQKISNLAAPVASTDAATKAYVDSGDTSTANELNTSVVLNGTTLEVTDAGGTKSANLDSLVDDGDWSYFSGTGTSGQIYRSGGVALGTYTDPAGYRVNVQNYSSGKGAVRGVNQDGIALYSEGQLGVLNWQLLGTNPMGLPVDISNIGVYGFKPAQGLNGAAVYGWNNDNTSENYAVLGIADGAGTTNYGIYGSALNATNNWAGYFDGDVGVNAGRLDMSGSGIVNGIRLGNDQASGVSLYHTADALRVSAPNSRIQFGTIEYIQDCGNNCIALNAKQWNLGHNFPAGSTTVSTDARFFQVDGAGGENAYIGGDGAGSDVQIGSQATGIKNVALWNTADSKRMDLYVGQIYIMGGSDLAEPFKVSDAGVIQPGSVLTIDPDHPGELRISSKPYDRTVAGIASGANGVNPGLIMKQEGSETAGNISVALTGRVYAKADASYGEIQPGDLLTTSATPGYAMKVSDYDKSHGAIIGKAMTSLKSGKGNVLVLVSLH